MQLVLGKDIFHKYFSLKHSSQLKTFSNLFFNEKNKIVISKNYLELLEKYVTDLPALQSVITELSDMGLLISDKADKNYEHDLDEAFLNIIKKSQSLIVFGLVEKDTGHLKEISDRVFEIGSTKKLTRDWIILELASKGELIVNCLDFKTNNEISAFFDNVFSLPKHIRQVQIFDRDHNSIYKSRLKGKYVYYYTCTKLRRFERLEILKQLRKEFGGKLQLFFTSDFKLLHERKILFEDFILTVDNSYNNVDASEKTWEITLYYSPTVCKDWIQKCNLFNLVE